MAEATLYEDGTIASDRPLGFGTSVNILGGLVSVALIAGLGLWSYDLAVRDVSGVPVVRALEGPMRVRPDAPGGHPAEHQGLAVNEVQADGVAGPMPERLILAPEPIQITEADVPEPAPLTEGPVLSATDQAVAAALAEIQLTDVEPVSALTTPQAPELAILPSDIPGVVRSPMPEPRPRLEASLRTLSDASPAAASGIDVPADQVASGTRLVQLGAYDTIEMAKAEWDTLADPFVEYFDGKNRVIQEATSGGRTFYRLRAMGFEDLADARRFCSVLLAEETPCIPVVAR